MCVPVHAYTRNFLASAEQRWNMEVGNEWRIEIKYMHIYTRNDNGRNYYRMERPLFILHCYIYSAIFHFTVRQTMYRVSLLKNRNEKGKKNSKRNASNEPISLISLYVFSPFIILFSFHSTSNVFFLCLIYYGKMSIVISEQCLCVQFRQQPTLTSDLEISWMLLIFLHCRLLA